MLTGGQEENWKNDLLFLGKILTTWLKLRGLQANQEFFGLLRTEGPRYHAGEILSWYLLYQVGKNCKKGRIAKFTARTAQHHFDHAEVFHHLSPSE